MLKLVNKRLLPNTKIQLQKWQKEVNQVPHFREKIEKAQKLFTQKNTLKNLTFQEVKTKLKAMCPGGLRCHYCEDSSLDQIEHIYPKALYPRKTFVWKNLLYVCGQCNRKKLDRFPILNSSGDVIVHQSLKGKSTSKVSLPPRGQCLFLNPRTEDPFECIQLDLNTFRFLPIPTQPKIEQQKAEQTIRLIDLNRESLCNARKIAFKNYLRLLELYCINSQESSFSAQKLKQLKKEFKEDFSQQSHSTVWKEMQRFYHDFPQPCQTQLPQLFRLFSQAPETLFW